MPVHFKVVFIKTGQIAAPWLVRHQNDARAAFLVGSGWESLGLPGRSRRRLVNLLGQMDDARVMLDTDYRTGVAPI
jgi:hypothetical protein